MKKLFSTRVSDNAFAFAMLVLRLAAGGLMMINHGYGKLKNFASMSNTFSDPIGIGSTASLSLVIFAEFFCAAFIILGLFTRLAAIPIIIAMSVALFIANNGDFFGKGELPGLFLICFIVILLCEIGRAHV